MTHHAPIDLQNESTTRLKESHMNRTIVAVIMVVVMVAGALGGLFVVATQNGSSSSPCYPLVQYSGWLLDHEAEC
jgi:hypothetical protein